MKTCLGPSVLFAVLGRSQFTLVIPSIKRWMVKLEATYNEDTTFTEFFSMQDIDPECPSVLVLASTGVVREFAPTNVMLVHVGQPTATELRDPD